MKNKGMDIYSGIKKIFLDEFGYGLYFIDETLEGAIAEKKLKLKNKSIVCAYLSKEKKRDDVVSELKNICKKLIEVGYSLDILESYIRISHSQFEGNLIIHFSWIDEEQIYITSSKTSRTNYEEMVGKISIEESYLLGEGIFIPMYEGKNFLEYLLEKEDSYEVALTELEINDIYWEQYYFNAEQESSSTFLEFCSNYINKEYIVVDIGCGSARDSFGFCRKGHMVVGLDKSEEAIEFAKAFSNNNKCGNIKFFVADVSNTENLSKICEDIRKQADFLDKKIIFYSRFFLHSICDESQHKLITTVSNYMKEKDLFAAEFRAIEDKSRKKIYDNHYRRFIDDLSLVEKLKNQYGLGNIITHVRGTGLSVFKDEDPFLARIICSK